MYSVVPIGEASVMVAVPSSHCHDALSAVSFAIDAINFSVTIWKVVYLKIIKV